MNRTLLVVTLFALAGCAQETSAPAPAPAPTSTNPGAATPPAEQPPPAETEPVAEAPKAPQLKQLMKMAGNLHVMWANVDDSCDSVVGERKTASTEYKVAFTVPGTVDNKHDSGAAGTETFTYRLRCKKGDTFSDYSNEMSGSPK